MADLADEEDVSAMFADMKKTKKKKKKKKKVVTEEGKADAAAAVAGVGAEEEAVTYEYADLLTRFYEILTSSNPDLLSRKKVSLKPPQILRIGTRRTLWANFPEICRTMQREPEHVFRFYLAELGTDGSIDGNGRFVIKGTYVPKYIESLLRKYISEYVSCAMCRGVNTNLLRDNASRLHFKTCEDCGARTSVTNISKGFHATGKGDRRTARNAKIA